MLRECPDCGWEIEQDHNCAHCEELMEDDSDEHDNCWDDEHWDDVYDAQGNTVYSPYYESLKVDRKCQGCGSTFRGMPNHGYCDPCADIIERGGELPEYDEEEV